MNYREDTRIAREDQARRNAAAVRAENAVRGERVVAGVRLLILAMRGTLQRAVPGLDRALPMDAARITSIVLYTMFALGTFLVLMRVKPQANRSFVAGLLYPLADFGFVIAMSSASILNDHRFSPELTVVALALYQCFAVVRLSWVHVAVSTALSCASYAFVLRLAGEVSPFSLVFVLVSFISLGVLLGWLNRDISRMFLDLRRRDNLSRLLPRAVVDRVLALGESLAPTQSEVTVLFSDIRDFTTLSESLAPRAVLALLDEYFVEMTQIVKAHDGMVNKFLGDGMLACWGVPEKNPQHAELALRAALDMRAKLVELNERRVRQGLPELRIGIGIHTGQVAAGMLGGADQHEYTIIGDTVNVASRIEGLTKARRTDILVSETTWMLAGGRFAGERIAEEQVKGRHAPVIVYSLEGTRRDQAVLGEVA